MLLSLARISVSPIKTAFTFAFSAIRYPVVFGLLSATKGMSDGTRLRSLREFWMSTSKVLSSVIHPNNSRTRL